MQDDFKTRTLAQQAGTSVVWKAIQLVVTKLIFLVRTLVLAAILFPEDFGLLSISLVALDFLVNISNLGLSQALIQKEIKNERVLDTIWSIGVLRGLILAATLFLSADFIAGLFNESRVVDILRILALKPIIDELCSVKVTFLMKELNFRSISYLKISESIINTVVAIILAPLFGVWALIFGIVAGSFTNLIFSYILAPYKPRFNFEIKSVLPFVSFGVWIFMISLIGVMANIVVQIIISRYLGASMLGLYYLSFKLAFITVEISSEVIGTVAFSVYSKVQSNLEKVASTWNIIIKGVAVIYFPIVCLMIGLSPYLVEFVLDSKWVGTEILIQLFAVAGILGIFGEMVVPILKGLGQPKKIMFIELFQSSLFVITVYFLSKQYGITGAASARIFSGAVSFISSIIFLKQIHIKPFEGNKIFISVIIVSSFLGTVVSLLILEILPSLVGFIFSTIIGISTIIFLIWISNLKFNLGISELIKKTFPQLKVLIKTNED